MANKFKGYLIKNLNTGAVLDGYIQFDKYDSTPNQREEIKAVRDENSRDLFRITADGHKTSISFTTKAFDLEKKMEFQKFFNDAMIITKERKVTLEYWNDEDNDYKTTDFYIPDIHFNIIRHTSDNIWYRPLEVDLVEY